MLVRLSRTKNGSVFCRGGGEAAKKEKANPLSSCTHIAFFKRGDFFEPALIRHSFLEGGRPSWQTDKRPSLSLKKSYCEVSESDSTPPRVRVDPAHTLACLLADGGRELPIAMQRANRTLKASLTLIGLRLPEVCTRHSNATNLFICAESLLFIYLFLSGDTRARRIYLRSSATKNPRRVIEVSG